MNEYHQQAEDFLKRNKIEFKAVCMGSTRKWGMLRYRYAITMTRTNKNGKELTFESPFYGSNADYTANKREIHAYDFLACISGNNFRNANEIISEFGEDEAKMDIDGILKEARKIRSFFTHHMIDELAEII